VPTNKASELPVVSVNSVSSEVVRFGGPLFQSTYAEFGHIY